MRRLALALPLALSLAGIGWAACPNPPDPTDVPEVVRAPTICLDRPANKIIVPSMKTTGNNKYYIGANETYNLQSTKMRANTTGTRDYPVELFDSPDGACLTRANVEGAQSLNLMWDDMKRTYDGKAIKDSTVRGHLTIEESVIYNLMDAIGFHGGASARWTVRGVMALYNRDDFVENDSCLPGLIEDVYVETFVGISIRPGDGKTCPRANTVEIKNALIWVKALPYDTDMGGDVAGGSVVGGKGTFWWVKRGPGMGQLVVRDTIIMVDNKSVNNWSSMVWPNGIYERVTFIWRGSMNYAGDPLPAGVTMTTDPAKFDLARAEWMALHDCDYAARTCTWN